MAMTLMLPHIPEYPDRIKLFEVEEGLAPLKLGHLAPGMVLPFHVFVSDGFSPGGLVLAYRQGQILPAEAGKEGWGYFAVSEAEKVLAHLMFRVEEVQAGGDRDGLDPLELLADTLLIFIQNFFCRAAGRTAKSLAAARGLIACLDRGLGDGGDASAAMRRLRRHDSGVFSHCLNVCLLALAFLRQLSWEADSRETFALGTLLHDLGMMPWAGESYHQTSPLSDRDWEEIKAHPRRGSEFLGSLQYFPEDVLTMLRQHHESPDGTGYPLGLTGNDIHSWARILRILDSYEAITSLRPWRPPMSERQALQLMTNTWSVQGGYDQDYLKRFLAFLHGE